MTLKWKNIINILKNNWLTKKITFMISLHLQKGQANFQSFSTCKAIRIFLIKVKPTIEQLHQLTASFAFLSPCSSEAGSKSTGSQTTVTGHYCHHRVQTKNHKYTANQHSAAHNLQWGPQHPEGTFPPLCTRSATLLYPVIPKGQRSKTIEKFR